MKAVKKPERKGARMALAPQGFAKVSEPTLASLREVFPLARKRPARPAKPVDAISLGGVKPLQSPS